FHRTTVTKGTKVNCFKGSHTGHRDTETLRRDSKSTGTTVGHGRHAIVLLLPCFRGFLSQGPGFGPGMVLHCQQCCASMPPLKPGTSRPSAHAPAERGALTCFRG